MKKDDFNLLLESVREAGLIRKGLVKPSREFEAPTAPPVDIKEVRRKLNVSQSAFSRMIGVSVNTLQNWEQGRRQPDGPARALLIVAAKKPAAVYEALHEKETQRDCVAK